MTPLPSRIASSKTISCSQILALLLLVAIQLLLRVISCHGAAAQPQPQHKQLVFLAGPQETAHTSMRTWFDQFATNYDQSNAAAAASKMGGGWKWPTLTEEEELQLQNDDEYNRRDIFKLLFQYEHDNTDPDIVLKAIRSNWESVESGIILGHDKFDKVIETPSHRSQIDALKVIHRVVEDLSVPREDVTIVLMYRTPRSQQWLQIGEVQSSYDEYEDFICNEDEDEMRREYLSTSMNIGLLSSIFLQNGFNVVIIDEEGTKQKGLDVSHVVACQVLKSVECTPDDFVLGLDEQLTEDNYPSPNQLEEWSELTLQQLHDLETLFLHRDCIYQTALESHDRFRILNQNTFFVNCDTSRDTSTGQKMMNANIFMNAIQTQKGCAATEVEASSILPYFPNTPSQENKKGTGELLLFALLVILLTCLAVLVYVLYRSHHKKYMEEETDGLVKKAPPRICFFRKRRLSGESTANSSDEESPVSSPTGNTGMTEVSLGNDQPETPPTTNLCNACRFIRIDPKCPYCFGGQPPPRNHKTQVQTNGTKNVALEKILSYKDLVESKENNKSFFCLPCAASKSGPDPNCPHCDGLMKLPETAMSLVDRGSGSSHRVDLSSFGQSQSAVLTPRLPKRESKSRAFRKLKELSQLKSNKDGRQSWSRTNLQGDRDEESVGHHDDESVISFSSWCESTTTINIYN